MAKIQKQQTSDTQRVGEPTVSAQPPAPQEAPRATHGEKQPAAQQLAAKRDVVKRHTPDHPSVTPALRTLVDTVHGTEYAILSAGKERAYIENKSRGFDILVATGEKA